VNMSPHVTSFLPSKGAAGFLGAARRKAASPC